MVSWGSEEVRRGEERCHPRRAGTADPHLLAPDSQRDPRGVLALPRCVPSSLGAVSTGLARRRLSGRELPASVAVPGRCVPRVAAPDSLALTSSERNGLHGALFSSLLSGDLDFIASCDSVSRFRLRPPRSGPFNRSRPRHRAMRPKHLATHRRSTATLHSSGGTSSQCHFSGGTFSRSRARAIHLAPFRLPAKPRALLDEALAGRRSPPCKLSRDVGR